MSKTPRKVKAILALMLILLSLALPAFENAALALSTGQTLYVNTPSGDVLRMRATPSTNGKILLNLPCRESVTYLGKSGSWYKVRWGNKTGYMYGSYLSTTKGGSSSSSGKSKITIGFHYVSHPYGQNVYVRSRADYDGKILVRVPDGSSIRVLEVTKYWCKVEYYDYIGWMSNDYIK